MKTLTILMTTLALALGCARQTPEVLQEKALQALAQKDYTAAVKHLEETVAVEPENSEAHYLLGQAYRQLLFDDGSKINHVDPAVAAKAAEHFRKVIEISPKYEGRKFAVGPYTKVQGVWSAVAMTYLNQGKTDSAVTAFKKGQTEGGFYPALMEYNRNIMRSCDPDAIIFTNGDNDTQPMWFLQLVEGYRPDVTVVNLSLLNVGWYIRQLKNDYPFGSNNVRMSFNDEEIDKLKFKFWSDSTMSLPARFDPLNPEEKIEWLMQPTVEDKIVRVQDLMVLEIIRTNNWQRPVYFSTTVAGANKIGMDDYLALEGLVFKLKSHQEEVSQQRLRHNVFSEYSYDGVHDEHLQYIGELQSLFRNYRYGFVQLAKSQHAQGQPGQVQKTLDRMSEKLPENVLPFADGDLKTEVSKLSSMPVE